MSLIKKGYLTQFCILFKILLFYSLKQLLPHVKEEDFDAEEKQLAFKEEPLAEDLDSSEEISDNFPSR